MARVVLSAALATVFWVACAGPPRIEAPALGEVAPWTHLEVADAPGDFHFALIGDRTGHARAGVFETAIEKLELLRPAFVLSVGDLIEGYTEDPAQLDAEWAEVDRLVGGLSMPFFYAAGNHDYSNSAMARDWVRRFGASYYSFRYQDVLFLVLNSELFSSVADPSRPIAGPELLAEQMRFAERTLEEHRDARWTIVIVHQPLWDRGKALPEWLRFEALLGERSYSVFAGHHHAYTKHTRRGRSYVTLATVGGMSRLRGVDRGEFDHVSLVSMSEEGPVLANLMLDGIHDEDVRTAATRSLVRKLERVVEVEPLRIEGERFSSGLQRFRFSNRSDQAVKVRVRFEPSADFRTDPPALLHELAPGASDSVEVSLRARDPLPMSELTPGIAIFEVEAEGERAPVRVESRSWLVPDRVFPVSTAMQARVLDGSLSEWGRLRFAMDAWPQLSGETAEASLRFDAALQAGRLHLAFQVRDATPVQDPALPENRQDGIRLSIDARPDPERSSNPGIRRAIRQKLFDPLLFATLSPGGGTPSEVDLLPPLPAGVERVVVPTEDGYRAEISIPFEWLDERAGEPWQRFRLNLVLQDWRPGEPGGANHAWRPIRYGIDGLPIEGAGTFERR